jgi:hypothetical protein
MTPHVRAVAVTAAVFLSGWTVRAGGPLTFNAAGPLLWSTAAPITYAIDDGPLGSIVDPPTMATRALDRWAAASGTLTFAQRSLGEDVTTGRRYIAIEDDDALGNVLVLDHTGDIVAFTAGEENRMQILGWATPLTSDDAIGRFVSLMNGKLASNPATVESTMVHEFGHALGLDHSQINADMVDGDPDNDQFIPTMFPTSTDDDATLIELNPDDVAWVVQLYGSPAARSTFGVLTGKLQRTSGPILGANVIAVAVKTVGAQVEESALHRYSCVSDYLKTQDGSFRMLVPPGQYRLIVEPIKARFTAGSSVGPYAESPLGLSFRSPIARKKFPTKWTVTPGGVTDAGVISMP